jgi:UDP-GlcNAc:undecaprenyl-phosphate GlcNAc-1-phosphate transferase
MFAIGLADDVRPIRPATKLVCQLAATSLFIYLVGPAAITTVPAVNLVLTCAWIVGITNAFNLLDNIDGLASGIAAIATAFFVVLLLLRGPTSAYDLALLATAMVGVAAGFLVFNIHPASVFMGDSGSHLLGSFIAGATLLATPHLTTSLGAVAIVPVIILVVPILDTAFVTLTRSLSGRSAFVGGRDHLSHRLVALGLGDRRAVVVLYVLAAAGGLVAISVQAVAAPAAWALTVAYGITLVATAIYLSHIDVSGQPSATAAPLPTELTTRYRVYEVVLDALLLGLGYYLAFLARFRGPQLLAFLPYFYKSLPIVIGLQIAPLWMSGKYRQVWRVLGPPELFNLARGLLTGVAASVIALLYVSRFEGYSRSVFLVDARDWRASGARRHRSLPAPAAAQQRPRGSDHRRRSRRRARAARAVAECRARSQARGVCRRRSPQAAAADRRCARARSPRRSCRNPSTREDRECDREHSRAAARRVRGDLHDLPEQGGGGAPHALLARGRGVARSFPGRGPVPGRLVARLRD